MSLGKILVSDNQGNYLLKFLGDVRVTLCGSLNRHMETIFGNIYIVSDDINNNRSKN